MLSFHPVTKKTRQGQLNIIFPLLSVSFLFYFLFFIFGYGATSSGIILSRALNPGKGFLINLES